MKVLLVEDNPLMLKSVAYLFKKFNFETIAAVDGRQGMELFKQEKPDIVVTDLMLPFATGQELIEYIRDNEKSHTWVVALSGMATQDARQHVFSLGADDFVQKPFMPAELILRVQRLASYR